MKVESLGNLEPIQPSKGIGKASRTEKIDKRDSVSISDEAVRKADWLKTIEYAKAAPDIRADRIAELKQKINDPNYITEKLLYDTADRIIDHLFGDTGSKLKL
jgi:negative regulator of flagellin synthesis FlgM